ncbi:DeoR/GlpR family DNA-binding transcription regulator [Lactobacillus jensenii]|jgi:lactose transport regulator|uniref:DeoR/GlpR family DNA-binding transcription regulator n=1 Tax=Lactobacillus jensenii TaxID=109790 RepID=A0A5N1IJL6_LACJE|nr:DeoR/GlpR family DNA-binding transcription regulator [Lactobacillus jensenii]ERJ43717.1 DeoR family transcriptional regulator [Lactobacillus jensenii MD IIE-70(2)]APT15262.1 DeoR family transcriptional regulator [Lactobacillus jensenii]EEQ25328.1 transcriptional regulator, DeoR family [Lactobacillus jensenii 269-3]EEX27130.1 transcriptional regulator, DeoR family [Lactobacillus jensenii SJ-7A-US]KAA9235457.1 DeoR/GlpR transcriptional regulator [Lactobacillus jensenii]
MLTQERQSIIKNYVDQHDFCRVADLCKLTQSSESTIRRDLSEMDQLGILRRVHGGAQAVNRSIRDIAQHIRFTINVEQKRKIAKYTVQNFVKPGSYIFLDAGTTVYEMVPFLKEIADLTVVTNSLDTAVELLKEDIPTRVLGGKLKKQTHAIVGEVAIKQLSELNFTAAFIGANGLSKTGNFTTPDPAEAAIKRQELLQAKQVFVLMDSAKLFDEHFAKFAHVSEVTLITNPLSFDQKNKLPDDLVYEEAD